MVMDLRMMLALLCTLHSLISFNVLADSAGSCSFNRFRWCFYTTVYPSFTSTTQTTMWIAWAGSSYDTWHHMYFTPKNHDCIYPTISFKFEPNDFGSSDEYLTFYDQNDIEIAKCGQYISMEQCGVWSQCFSGYNLGITKISKDTTLELSMFKPQTVSTACGYTVNARLTITCFAGSVSPTMEPTLNPTIDPTVTPTINPTNEPTVQPTLNPTNPTIHPTIYPTSNPTNEPTVQPTQNPSNPTIHPTIYPTINPSFTPTINPTDQPIPPTPFPTKNPSIAIELIYMYNEIGNGQIIYTVLCIFYVFLAALIAVFAKRKADQECDEIKKNVSYKKFHSLAVTGQLRCLCVIGMFIVFLFSLAMPLILIDYDSLTNSQSTQCEISNVYFVYCFEDGVQGSKYEYDLHQTNGKIFDNGCLSVSYEDDSCLSGQSEYDIGNNVECFIYPNDEDSECQGTVGVPTNYILLIVFGIFGGILYLLALYAFYKGFTIWWNVGVFCKQNIDSTVRKKYNQIHPKKKQQDHMLISQNISMVDMNEGVVQSRPSQRFKTDTSAPSAPSAPSSATVIGSTKVNDNPWEDAEGKPQYI